MSRFKLILCLAMGAGVACFIGSTPRPGDPAEVWQQSAPRLSIAQVKESQVMMMNVDYGASLAWQAAVSRAMLLKANWLANRLNLPIKRPIYTTDVRTWCIGKPYLDVLREPMPSPYPDTVFGHDIYNTNFSRLRRILALKFGLQGVLDTSTFEFSFNNGQLQDIARRDASQGERSTDGFANHMKESQPIPDEAAQAYQLATNWLAAADVNLDMLEKSRLPHPVHKAQYQFPGDLLPQPVYFVDWGTNYYGMYWAYQFWHTNEWHPTVSLEIGPHNELLEMYIGDPTFFRNSPMLIPSKTLWRLVHTPNPPLQYLKTTAGMREFIMTTDEVSDYASHLTNRLWLYEHHQLDPVSTMLISNDLKRLNSELIPYTNNSTKSQ
ncbi:MAG TPA: hypothetical protein VMF08_19850 [Candidatus Sulfotelmatobacter sp.]|nr:hypothetical protein [Candidatus Sulfotelmatobacter sp.]